MQNCLSRASKYTLFDATKELAFVPLSDECKHRGKSAIDGVGSRLGKSGGSFFLTGLIFTFGSLSNSIPFIALIFLVVIAIWMFAASALGKEFSRLTTPKEGDDTPSPTEEVVEAKSEAIG
jgi:ATP:ADP antiporter, AAA family